MTTVHIAYYETYDEQTPIVIGVFTTLEKAQDGIAIMRKFTGDDLYDDWVSSYTLDEMQEVEKVD